MITTILDININFYVFLKWVNIRQMTHSVLETKQNKTDK